MNIHILYHSLKIAYFTTQYVEVVSNLDEVKQIIHRALEYFVITIIICRLDLNFRFPWFMPFVLIILIATQDLGSRFQILYGESPLLQR